MMYAFALITASAVAAAHDICRLMPRLALLYTPTARIEGVRPDRIVVCALVRALQSHCFGVTGTLQCWRGGAGVFMFVGVDSMEIRRGLDDQQALSWSQGCIERYELYHGSCHRVTQVKPFVQRGGVPADEGQQD